MVVNWGIPAWLAFLIGVALIAVVVVAAMYALRYVMRFVSRGRPWAENLQKRFRPPLVFVILAGLFWTVIVITLPPGDGRPLTNHLFLIALIVAIAWLIEAVIVYFLDIGVARYAVDGSDGWQARRARTQFLVLRRLIVAAIVVIAGGAILLTFPGVRAFGTTMLASAGLLSVVAGLAAQSTLGNVFAGMQLAFSGAVRLEDVVVVDDEWGYIEEITLTYVVVRIWDERRLVLPSTYFTQQPYENWTRHSSAVLGTVYFDLDWGVDLERMRVELDKILDRSGLWDGEASSLRITDTVGGYVQVRALISADDAFKMFDLSRNVREEMLLWLQKNNPEALPRTRFQAVERDGEVFPRRKPVRKTAAAEGTEARSRGDETRPPALSHSEAEAEDPDAASDDAAGGDADGPAPDADAARPGQGAPTGASGTVDAPPPPDDPRA